MLFGGKCIGGPKHGQSVMHYMQTIYVVFLDGYDPLSGRPVVRDGKYVFSDVGPNEVSGEFVWAGPEMKAAA